MRKVRLHMEDAWNHGDRLAAISLGAAGAVVMFIVVLLTSPLAGVSVFFSEWLLALLVIPLGVAYRIVFRRPWCLYAESADRRDVYVASVAGWEISQRVITEVAEHLHNFGAPPESWVKVDQHL